MPYRPWLLRKFGAEFEMNRQTRQGETLAETHIRNALMMVRPELPLNHRRAGYYHSDGSTWDIKTDSSCGWEIAAPALTLDETGHNDEMRAALDALGGLQPLVNAQCGTHVHVECLDYDWQALQRLVILWSRYEPFFFELMPVGRRTNSYCHPIRTTAWTDRFQQGRRYAWPAISRAIRARREDTFRESISNHAGRGSLNLGHWWRNGRVEFRLHSGTLDYTKITRWMMLLGAVVKRVVNEDLPEIQPTENDGPSVTLPTDYICRQLGLLPSRVCPDVPPESVQLVAWLDRRRQQFTPGAGRPVLNLRVTIPGMEIPTPRRYPNRGSWPILTGIIAQIDENLRYAAGHEGFDCLALGAGCDRERSAGSNLCAEHLSDYRHRMEYRLFDGRTIDTPMPVDSDEDGFVATDGYDDDDDHDDEPDEDEDNDYDDDDDDSYGDDEPDDNDGEDDGEVMEEDEAESELEAEF